MGGVLCLSVCALCECCSLFFQDFMTVLCAVVVWCAVLSSFTHTNYFKFNFKNQNSKNKKSKNLKSKPGTKFRNPEPRTNLHVRTLRQHTYVTNVFFLVSYKLINRYPN